MSVRSRTIEEALEELLASLGFRADETIALLIGQGVIEASVWRNGAVEHLTIPTGFLR